MKSGWETKKLGDCIKLQYGKPLHKEDRNPNGKYAAYGANGIKERTDHYYHDKPSIIVGRKGSAGEVTLVDVPFWPLDLTYFVEFDETKFDLKYLYNLLCKLNLPRLAKGVKPGINRNDVYAIEVSYPELKEQQRIVAILDEAFAGIATATVNAEKNLQNARELFESTLQSVFAEKGEGWEEKRLGDSSLLNIIDGDRGTNYPQKADFFSEGHCLFLNTKNVRPYGFDFSETMFITAEKDGALRKGKLKRNDVVMTTRGTLGNLAVYDNSVEYEHVRINSGMLIFRPKLDKLLPAYLFEVLRSGIMKSQITLHSSGAAQPQLPIKTLVNFTLPVPNTLKAQESILNRLKEVSDMVKELEIVYKQKLNDLAELKQSILQKAFAGELH